MDGLQELRTRLDLGHQFLLLSVILFGPFQMLDDIVELEGITANELLPNMVVVVVVGAVEEVYEVDCCHIQHQTAYHVANQHLRVDCELRVKEHEHQQHHVNHCDHSHVVDVHLVVELQVPHSEERFFYNQIDDEGNVDQDQQDHLDHGVVE
jgi:hypothetical protein